MSIQPDSPKSLLSDAIMFLISEAAGYAAFVMNFPFVMSLLASLIAVVLVLQDVYGLTPLVFLQSMPLLAHWQGEFHFNGSQLLRFYAVAAFVFFLIAEGFRLVFHRPRPTLKRRLITAFIFATLTWGFVLAHVPVMRVAPNTSRFGLGMVFVAFYAIGLAGFTMGAIIKAGADALIDRLRT